MGADLYVKDMPREAQYTGFRADTNVGYFRDCYNANGLFAKLSNVTGEMYSWWQMDTNHPEWFERNEEDGTLLKAAFVPAFKELILKAKPQMDKRGNKEYRDWYKQLLDFCDVAIKHNSDVIWSV